MGFSKCYTLEYQVFSVSRKLHVNSSSISWPIMPCCQWVSFGFVSNWALSWCLRDCTKNPIVTSLTLMLKQFPLCPNKVLRSSAISTSPWVRELIGMKLFPNESFFLMSPFQPYQSCITEMSCCTVGSPTYKLSLFSCSSKVEEFLIGFFPKMFLSVSVRKNLNT